MVTWRRAQMVLLSAQGMPVTGSNPYTLSVDTTGDVILTLLN